MVSLNLKGLTEKQTLCVKELATILDIEVNPNGKTFEFTRKDGPISIKWDGQEGVVSYSKPHHFSRCVGLIYEHLLESDAPFELEEAPCYDVLGLMHDISRNGVITLDTFRDMTKRLALMGYSMIQLYAEDVYEMKEYPYFGYMRPRLSAEDIKEMDKYTQIFGIELTPCIQTLAHLRNFLCWEDSAHLADTEDILLVGSPDTYEFIEAQFRTMAECFTSRRINIGLDEAHMLGLGKYLDKNGYKTRKELMLEHCLKVFEIARKYDFRPMMWSDMFFVTTSPVNEYYHIDQPMDPELVEKFPDDVDLIYWDYHNTDRELVDGMFRLHKDVTDNVVFAPGAWKWNGFAPNNRFSQKVCLVQHEACRKFGVTDVVLTAWGDNGNLASSYSMMPTVQLWAEMCYRNNYDEIRTRFKTCMDADYDEFCNLDMPNIVKEISDPPLGYYNPGTYILYNDVLMGLFDKHIAPYYAEHYSEWAAKFDEYVKNNTKWAYLFETMRELCSVLELKCNVGIDLYNAYQCGDRKTLEIIAKETLPEIIRRARKFHETVTKQWYRENQIIGLDSIDLKLGGVITRIEAAHRRVNEYLDGKVDELQELTRERLPFFKMRDPNFRVTTINNWKKNVTANVLN
ncbi:MAG: beta-N-acetylhexosaminidase [Oscillospiraceae bacterium]|nr:beta-N-acetylhexosaminidase [Oscillospiraceae bacterium]